MENGQIGNGGSGRKASRKEQLKQILRKDVKSGYWN